MIQTASRKFTTPWLAVAVLAGGPSFPVTGTQKTSDRPYTIAYGSFAPVRPNLFIADGNGEHIKPLLRNADVDYNASFSRDGVWIVFTSERNGSADIYRAHADGSALERLTDDPAFDDQGVLSPDGRTLAFVSTRGGAAHIWLLDLGTRKLTCLTRGSTGDFRPVWSPDGEWIAFSSDRAGSTDIWVGRRDGSDLRRLTFLDGFAGTPRWSPDGKKIVFESTRDGQSEIYWIDTQTKWTFSISAHARTIAYCRLIVRCIIFFPVLRMGDRSYIRLSIAKTAT